MPGSGLELSLVYNPGGAFLPPPQAKLEEDYRRELKRAFGIQFTNLIAIANMPIKRFADDLRRQDKLLEYLELLVDKFNPRTIDGLMCVNQVHVAWDGQLYDCDFNYALEMPSKLHMRHCTKVQILESSLIGGIRPNAAKKRERDKFKNLP